MEKQPVLCLVRQGRDINDLFYSKIPIFSCLSLKKMLYTSDLYGRYTPTPKLVVSPVLALTLGGGVQKCYEKQATNSMSFTLRFFSKPSFSLSVNNAGGQIMPAFLFGNIVPSCPPPSYSCMPDLHISVVILVDKFEFKSKAPKNKNEIWAKQLCIQGG